MAVTQNTYTGNGTNVLFSFTFPYIEESDIKVEVNDSPTTAYTFANATTIQFNTAPANGAFVRIYRQTDTDTAKATFYPGSAVRAQDLNENTTQTLYSVQEWRDQTVPLYNAVLPDDINMGGNQINNLGNPTSPQDAVTKSYADTTFVDAAGDTMSGQLNMGSNKVVNMAEPTSSHDAATKNYVDTTTWNNTSETIDSGETWVGDNSYVATTGAIDNRIDSKIDTALTTDVIGADGVTITDNVPGSGQITVGLGAGSVDLDRIKPDDVITTGEQDAGSPSWVSEDGKIATAGAIARRHDMLVQPGTPSGSQWNVGKLWLQNDVNKTLSYWTGGNWSGITSGGTFTLQPTVIYVDSVNGDDANDGHRIINPKKTIKNAVASANAGDIIRVVPGVYREILPIDITVANLSIVGDAQRSCFVHPTPATETQVMFRCNSGTYIDGFTFVGLKASGARGGHPIDNDATYGLPANQGWVAGFYPGCVIRKSPFINNCTNFADSAIDNSNFDPNNYQGTGGDTSSAPTGGGIIVDGSLPAVSSPLRSFVINEFTQVCLDGPGLLVCNNGYAQAVSFFGLFCHYHAKALSGGQINMEVGTTDFGRYGLIADGKSTTPIFTATANGAALAGATTFAINAPVAGGSWFGDANRPAINMLVQIGSDIYPILSSTPNGGGWNVTISRPNPNNRAENLGLINGHSNGASVSFFLRSMISTASHTMEYAGSGCDYNALPENGGVPNETNEAINRNNGRVWLTSTDQSGKFKVGDTFQVDQQTGFVTIDPNSYSTNLVTDLSPQLGGDLDVLARKITTTLTNGDVVIEPNGSGKVKLDVNYWPNADGAANTVIRTDGSGNLSFGLIADANIAANAEIAVSKLADGAARQVLQTAANGTDVEWTDNIDLPGTLDVTGAATFDTSVKLPNGTAAAPSLHFTGDVNTGLYWVSADVLGVTTNGTNKVRFDDTTAPLKEVWSSTFYPVVTGVDIGTANDQVPLNSMLGQLAFLDDITRIRASATAPTNNLDINFEYVSDTSIRIRMRGSDGVVRSTTLTLS